MANVSSSNGLEKYPKLRFKGFSEPWTQVLLSDFFKKSTKKNSDGSITNVICNSAKNGLIPQREYFDKSIANSDNTDGYYIIEQGDFVYNPRKSSDAPYGPVSIYKYPESGIVSPLYLCFRALKPINSSFYDYFFKSPSWHRYIYLSGDSGARHDRVSIKDDVFFSMPVCIPSEEEQLKISSFLSLIEKRIADQQQLVEHLKKYKRGLLKDILNGKFSSCGLDVATWEYKSLGELFHISAGGDIDKDRFSPIQTETHLYPVYANAKTNEGLYGYASYYKSEGNTITVSGRGEVGYAVARRTKYVPIVRLLSLSPKTTLDIDFYALIINSTKIYVESTGVPQLTSPQLGKVIVPYTDIETQNKISQIFNGVDNRINKGEQELQCLCLLKQAFLKNLFI